MKFVWIRSQLALFAFTPFLVVSCGKGSVPDSQLTEISKLAPLEWAASKAGKAGVDEQWVSRFGDRRLNALVAEAITNNASIASARERVQRAVIVAKGAQAPALPQANVALNGNRNQQVFVGLPIPGFSGALSSISSTLGASLDVSWEPDIWGEVAASQSLSLIHI